jgi:hypothetical protein
MAFGPRPVFSENKLSGHRGPSHIEAATRQIFHQRRGGLSVTVPDGMSANFEELDYQKTLLGDLILRRRRMLSLGGIEVYEVKLGDAFLMSSLFHEVEEALAHFGLGDLKGDRWDVVVGGLGLGYTAAAALEHREVTSLLIVDALQPVIGWHQAGLVPLGETLTRDPRTRMVHADFFECAQSANGFDPESFTRSCWISTIRRPTCCIRKTERFIKLMVCALSRRTCIPVASSRSGRTIRRMRNSWRLLAASLRPQGRISSRFLIRSSRILRPARCMSRAKVND